MAATLEAAGGGASGQQVRGVAAQYQLDGVNGVSELSSTSINPGGGPSGISPYDSGTILGTVPPGRPGIKLVDGTVQRSSQIIADSTPGVVGNALVPIYNVIGSGATRDGLPTKPVGQGQSAGLSATPESE
jgi:hypothetical protein